MRQDPNNEQMAFGLASTARTAEGVLLPVTELLLPDRHDLSEQTAVSVSPTLNFQSFVYFRAYQTSKVIVEFHSHPGAGTPRFSGIDDAHAPRNARYIARKMPGSVTLALVVGNSCFDAFDAMVYDRNLKDFRPIRRLEMLGRPSQIRLIGEPADVLLGQNNTIFDRQTRVPGWNQLLWERQLIGIVGLGGNGAPLFQTLVGMGAGRQGFYALVDPDRVEVSNLPRIPYALPEHVGLPKVTVATQFAGRKDPRLPVYPFPCRFAEEAVLKRLKMVTVLFGCGDNDGLRKETNEFAVRYGIPYIDLGCDIQTDVGATFAGGQVRLSLPGENACLVCCGGYDASQAAIDQLDEGSRSQRAAHGCGQDATEVGMASVANLNGLTAQFAVTQFLSLINGPKFATWDYLHFDSLTGRTLPARSERSPACPLCGDEGCLGAGDPIPAEVVAPGPSKLRRLLLKP
jgi:molybdopterin/thiamine biosynthesis adenylyltransferase